MTDATNPESAALFNDDATALEITQLRIEDHEVIQEARRWTTGQRGPMAESGDIPGADVTRFVTEAIGLGARAIAATGQAQEAQALSHLIKDVGDRANKASTTAAELTAQASKDAAQAILDSSERARKAVAEVNEQQSKAFADTVSKANAALLEAVTRVFGGENPELLTRLQPILVDFAAGLDAKVAKQTEELLSKAARQFDPSDPTTPMAKHAAAMKQQYDELDKHLASNFSTVLEKLTKLETAVAVEQAVGSLAKVTPIKGGTYEQSVNFELQRIAAGLGDEYTATGKTVGSISRCFKGDGVLTLNGGAARVVLEMTDSPRSDWTDYLDVAERNRDALAALGLVRTPEQNGGHAVRTLGPRRVVLAYDPDSDSPDMLRTTVLLLRTSALAAVSRAGREDLDRAAEKIEAAREQLGNLNVIKKAATSIGKGATKIEIECDKTGTAIRRTLTEALTAIEGAEAGDSEAILADAYDDQATA